MHADARALGAGRLCAGRTTSTGSAHCNGRSARHRHFAAGDGNISAANIDPASTNPDPASANTHATPTHRDAAPTD